MHPASGRAASESGLWPVQRTELESLHQGLGLGRAKGNDNGGSTSYALACAATGKFWTAASTDQRIGETFARVCAANGRHLQRVAEHL